VEKHENEAEFGQPCVLAQARHTLSETPPEFVHPGTAVRTGFPQSMVCADTCDQAIVNKSIRAKLLQPSNNLNLFGILIME
jgi:hypothetical protein